MQKNPELEAAFERLENSIAGLSREEALRTIDAEISNPLNANHKPHFEIFKAHSLWPLGLKREAIELLVQCANEHDDLDEVHYHLGEYLVEVGEFERAIPHLTRCIEIADSLGDQWYAGAAYKLRAYCAARLGNLDLARSDLTKIDDDQSMIWIEVKPVVSKRTIKGMIEEQAQREVAISECDR
jgi:tetratricopeptide (TPR) repeat protein